MNNTKFLDLINQYKTISIIGMDKNAGKTTTLNHIIKETRGIYSLGLTSIGRDGEDLDRVTATEKPKIYVEKGTVIATAKQCLFNSDITKEIIDTTGITTPMGEIVIARAHSDGFVDLGGPSVNSQIVRVCNQLRDLGSDMVIVDGALGRKSSASPAVTEGTILSVGASLSRNINKVIEQTAYTVTLLTLEGEENQRVLDSYEYDMTQCKAAVIYKGGEVKTLDILTSLDASKDIIDSLNEEAEYVIIKGAISDKLIEEIMKGTSYYKGVTFVAEDGTKLFLNKDTLYKFTKQGGILKVIKPINIICLTCNPSSPYGYEFDKDDFLQGLRSEISIPVFDVLGGE